MERCALEKLKILIVDDEKDITKFSREFFAKKGLEAFTALSGNSAINQIKKNKPHIALLDIYLPGNVSGMDVLKFIYEANLSCKCVMITKEDDKSVMKEARRYGAYDYLTKPITLKELERKINQAIREIRKEAKKHG